MADSLFARSRYLAGSDEVRAGALQGALDDPSTRAVWAVRGGYGLGRILGRLELGAVRKLLLGFSDLTALHAATNAQGLVSIHGPNVGQLGELTEPALARLAALLAGEQPGPLTGGVPLVAGRASGRLLGGNLTVLASLVGSPHLPPLTGAILLLEDVGESPYRLDRAFTQLRNAGLLDGVRGLALGQFPRCDPAQLDFGSREVLADLAVQLGVPSAIGFPVGHVDDNRAVPLGVEVELDADGGTLTFARGLD